jgi:hypothetical protein
VIFFREKFHLLNEQLSNSFSPLQLITITALVTTFGLGIYRFLFAHDESKFRKYNSFVITIFTSHRYFYTDSRYNISYGSSITYCTT